MRTPKEQAEHIREAFKDATERLGFIHYDAQLFIDGYCAGLEYIDKAALAAGGEQHG